VLHPPDAVIGDFVFLLFLEVESRKNDRRDGDQPQHDGAEAKLEIFPHVAVGPDRRAYLERHHPAFVVQLRFQHRAHQENLTASVTESYAIIYR